MSVKAYRGNRGKNIYEINNFSRGINNTNASINNGQVKEMVNFRISPDGMSLRPREPFINYTFFIQNRNEDYIYFPKLSESIGVFTSKQFPNKEFIVDFKGKKEEYEILIGEGELVIGDIVDGDTFRFKGVTYRLLLIDTPEFGEPGFEEAKKKLTDLMVGEEVVLLFDPQAPSWVDAFGRHLVWAYRTDNVNINKAIYEDVRTKTVLLDDSITEHVYGDVESWINPPEIKPYPGFIPVVYERDLNESPYLIGTDSQGGYFIHREEPKENLYRPAYKIKFLHNVYLGGLLNDLDLGYSTVPNISINKINSTYNFYSTEYIPIIHNAMPSNDGLVLLGTVGHYKGLITVDLEIPLMDDGSTPDFNNYKINFNSYRKNVRKINFEDLGRHSQNLLDTEPISHSSVFGQQAIDDGYTYPSLRTFLFRGQDGKYYSQLQRNKNYDIIPLVALPKFDEDVNGIDPDEYDGYAYKWEIIKHNHKTSESDEDVITTINWKYVRDSDGTPAIETAGVLEIDPDEEDVTALWRNTSVSNRYDTTDDSKILTDVITDPMEGDLFRRPILTKNFGSGTGQRNEDDYVILPKYLYGYGIDNNGNYDGGYIKKQALRDTTLANDYKTNNNTNFNYFDIQDNGRRVPGTIGHPNPNGEGDMTWEKFKGLTFKEKVTYDGSTKSRIDLSDIYDSDSEATPYFNYGNYSTKRPVVWPNEWEEFVNEFLIMPTNENYEYFIFTKEGVGNSILSTRLPYFNDSNLGVQVRLHIAPARKPTVEDPWTEAELEKMAMEAEVVTSPYIPYQTTEVELPSLNNTSTIRDSRFITFFEDMLVLYGGTTHSNLIYLSDFNNVSYFPFKYALDQIPDEVIHIHTFKGVMIVFTKSDIWAIEKVEFETETGSIVTDFYAKKILQNVFIDVHLKNTVRTVGNFIMVMLEDRIIFLKPNNFTGDSTDLSYIELSAPIGNIIKDPSVFVKERLTMYNIFTEDDLKFDLATEVDNRDFKIILSTFLKEEKTPYMLEIIYDGTKGVWTLNDTLSTAYPIYFNKGLRYFKSHPELSGGIVLTETTGVNKYKMLDRRKAHVDIHNFSYTEDNIVTLPDGFLVKPINTLLDLGYMNVSNQLTKRFQEARIEMTNINTNVINMGYDFRIDNKQQQTTYEIFMKVKDGYLMEEEAFSFNTVSLNDANLTSFESFLLDLSKFPTASKLDIRIPVNGRGRIPRLMTSMEITNDFEIFRFLIIFKEQSGRMVSQR